MVKTDRAIIKYIKAQLWIFQSSHFNNPKNKEVYAEELAGKIINKVRTGKPYPKKKR